MSVKEATGSNAGIPSPEEETSAEEPATEPEVQAKPAKSAKGDSRTDMVGKALGLLVLLNRLRTLDIDAISVTPPWVGANA